MVPGAAWYGMPPPGRCVGEVGEKRRPSDLWKEERRWPPAAVADDRAGYGLIRRDGGSTSCCTESG